MTEQDWLKFFAFHEPSPSQHAACVRIRSAVAKVATIYIRETKAGAEQTANLRGLKAAQNAMLGHIVAGLPDEAF